MAQDDGVPTLADVPPSAEAAATSDIIGQVVAVQPTSQELEKVRAAAATLEEVAEDLERIAVASSADSSLDETDIDMLVDADLDKVQLYLFFVC
jgi:hypothetical protein